MCAHRLWPTVQALGRGLITNRNEIFQQGVRAYNVQNFNNGYLSGQGYQHGASPGHDHLTWTQRVAQSSRGSFNKTVSQSFHSGQTLFVKEFQDSENEQAHAILRSLPAYSTTTVGSDTLSNGNTHTLYCSSTDWESCSAQEVADGFISISQMCHHQPMNLGDTQYSILCKELAKKVSYLDDQHLLRVLSSLSLWPPIVSSGTQNFVGLWNSLDEICTKRMKNWNMSQMFLVADHWYALRLSRISMYNVQMTKILGRQVTSMAPTQLVQYLFYANLSRKLGPFIFMKDLEKRILEVLHQVSIEELGVIAMGFFKTQTLLRNEKLIDAIIKKTQENIEFVSDVSLSAILKVLRKSIPTTRFKATLDLLDSLHPQVGRLNNMCLLQVALLGNNLLIFHEKIIDAIAAKFSEDMNQIRLKEIERISYALMLYNYTPKSCPDIFLKIAQELRREERIPEINYYPKCFVSCLVYLGTMGVFPNDLISASLQPSMLNLLSKCQNYVNMEREVVELDWSLEIEGSADYSGYRLNPDTRRQMSTKFLPRLPSKFHPDLTHQEKLILEVQEKLSAILGGNHLLAISNILPYVQTPDLVFCTSSDGEPVELPQEFLDLDSADLKRPLHLERGLKWNAIIVAGRSAFIRNTSHMQGNVQKKQRQLSCLGYHVSVVPHMEFSRKSVRAKLGLMERVLKEGSSLNMDGRIDTAYVSIRGFRSVHQLSQAAHEEMYG